MRGMGARDRLPLADDEIEATIDERIIERVWREDKK